MNDSNLHRPEMPGTSVAAKKPNGRLRMLIMLGAAFLVFGMVFAAKYFGKQGMNAYFDHMPVPPATVTTDVVKTMTWDNHIETIGTLVPVNGTDVTTEVGGIVRAIHFESGQHVNAGAPLVTLDSANEQGDLKRLQAQALLAELNRKRREQLFKMEAISKSDYDAAVAEANAAKAAVEAQAGKLAQKEIHAPFTGQLGIRRINVGQYLSPGTAIVTLQALDPIDVDFSLPEQDLGLVSPGLKVSVEVEAYANTEFPGEVLAIEPKVDAATRNFRLRARLPNPDHKLHPGQFGRVQLTLPGERTLVVVPRTAIAYSSYGNSVFVVQKMKDAPPKPQKPIPGAPPYTDLEVIQKFVKTGDSRGDFVAVTEGLSVGDQVVSSGLLKLRNQQPILIDNSLTPNAELNPTPDNG